MSLSLSIVNVDRLENGESLQLVLDKHGAVIGRSPHADWSLPDPRTHISSVHCEVDYRDGAYLLIDKSSNGTFINGSSMKMQGPHLIVEGDEIVIGHYRVLASLTGASARPAPPKPSPSDGWVGAPVVAPPQPAWTPQPSAPASPAWAPEPAGAWGPPEAAPNRWNAPGAAISGRGPMNQAWDPPVVAQPAPPPHPSGVDVWARVAQSHGVVWERAGFESPNWGDPHDATPQQASIPPPPALDAWPTVLAAAGIADMEMKGSPRETAAAAGALLRRLVAGLVVMLESRARAKAELGAAGTRLEFDGNNPLKFARSPEQALARMLNPQERGFMSADHAVEDAYKDLQAHQIATLSAMQSALAVTLDRFSPAAIRERAQPRGLFAALSSSARNAQLWTAYERDFEGVAQGSDEAFMDVFSKCFRQAYEKAAAEMKGR